MGELDTGGPHLRHRIVSAAGGRVELKLDGELDMATAEQLRMAVDHAIAAATAVLVLDVAELRFADSSGIALWVSWSSRVPRVEVHNRDRFSAA